MEIKKFNSIQFNSVGLSDLCISSTISVRVPASTLAQRKYIANMVDDKKNIVCKCFSQTLVDQMEGQRLCCGAARLLSD